MFSQFRCLSPSSLPPQDAALNEKHKKKLVLHFTLAMSPRAASQRTDPASCQGTHSKLSANLVHLKIQAPGSQGGHFLSQDDFFSVLKKSSPISEAHWKPLNCWGLSPVPSISWLFFYIPLHPLETPAEPKQVRSPWTCCGAGSGPSLWLQHPRVTGQDRAWLGQMKD